MTKKTKRRIKNHFKWKLVHALKRGVVGYVFKFN